MSSESPPVLGSSALWPCGNVLVDLQDRWHLQGTGDVRPSRTCLLPGGVENCMLSLPALWGAHLSGWNCVSHALWTRTWRPSLTCDQHSIWENGHSKLFWKGVLWIFLQVSVQLGLGFGVSPLESNCGFPSSLGFGIWLQPRNRHIPQRPDAAASLVPQIMEFYWSRPEAWGGYARLHWCSCIHSTTMRVPIITTWWQSIKLWL